MINIPTVETERLYLRPMKIQDWPEYLEMMISKRSVYLGGPYSVEEAWGWFCHDVAQWTLMNHGALTIIDRNTESCFGQVSINHGPLFPERELGWTLYPHAEGKGYAFEAVTAMRDWAFRAHGLKTLVSYIDPNNDRSIRLAERLGAKLDMQAPRQDKNDLVYRHSVA